jgi:hypothetical protein
MFSLPAELLQQPPNQQQPQTAPVYSPIQGLARALQMGVNGWIIGQQRANAYQNFLQAMQPPGFQPGTPSAPSDTGTAP